MISERKTALKSLWLYFAALTVFWAILAVLLLNYGYYGTFRLLNPFHHPITDNLSLYFLTHLGDGVILPGILILWIGRKDPGLALAGIITVLATGLLIQFLKHVPFETWDRPPLIFEGDSGIQIFHPKPPKHTSFPSGHSASMISGGLAFAIYLGGKKRWLALAVGVFSAMLCYTRPVVGVHFQGDILAGGMIGGITGALLLIWILPKCRKFVDSFAEPTFRKIRTVVFLLAAAAIIGQFINQIFFRL